MTLKAKRTATISDIHFFIQTSTGQRAAIIDLRPIAATLVLGRNEAARITGTAPLDSLTPDEYGVGLHVRSTHFTLTEWEFMTLPLARDTEARLYPIQFQGPAFIQATDLAHARSPWLADAS